MKSVCLWVLLVGSFLLLAPTTASTQTDSRAYELRVYQTAATSKPPRIDGNLDDECWSAVEWASDFVQWEPAEGEPPTSQTAFKILYDASALYIAYRAFDEEPSRIAEILSRRDRFPGDWVEINIDSYHDRTTAFSFTASASGVRGDEFVSQDGDDWDGNWDPIWELETRIDDQGWTAEVRIPLSQLRFANHEDQVWGIQVQRRLYRKEERSIWQPKSKEEPGWVSRFGELRGIHGIRPQRQVELLPYTVGRGERFRKVPGNPFRDGSTSDFELGLDGKVGVSSNLTLDFTVNPDFGQVEADPSEVNLSAFETFFSEKRPFFIEGRSILDFRLAPAITGGSFTSDNLFYSRRIGRAPSFRPDLGPDEYADTPTASSITVASKLTGRTRRGLSIGVLESVTAKEKARIHHLGQEHDETVEPLSNFFVGRAQQDLRQGNTKVGAMVTAVNRNIDDLQLEFLHRSAYAGGLDVQHQWRDKSLYVAGTLAASRVQGEPEALLATQRSSAHYFQRPDNDYQQVDSTRTSLAGHAGAMKFGKSGGKHWQFESGVAWRSPGFETNDMGFLRRADEVNQFTWMGYSIRNPFSIFRRMEINFNEWVDWDFGGTLLSKQANTNFNTNFKNNWQCGAGVTRTWERVSNFALRGGPSSRWPGDWGSWFWVNSDFTKPLSTGFGADFSDTDEGSGSFRRWWVDLTYRPIDPLTVSFSPAYATNQAEMQFVGIRRFGNEDRFLFGSLDQETVTMTVRLDYAVRPNLTVQYYGAPFLSAGAYRDFKRITSPRADAYRDRFQVYEDAEIALAGGTYEIDENQDATVDYTLRNPDFNFRDFNSNLVVRWEFQPGSLLYLVWTQARNDFARNGRFALNHDIGDLFHVHPHNIFLMKISKWLSI